jgi:dienelactone hydrolase
MLAVGAGLAGCGATPQQVRPSGAAAPLLPQPPGEGDSAVARSAFAAGEIVVRFTDRTRSIALRGQPRRPRVLLTVIRYPAAGAPSRADVPDAAPARGAGPFPLIVFAHGFATPPAPYAPLLRAWARAGYVVAAPIFPLENAHAPGGPQEGDLVNEPGDLSFVISALLAASAAARGPLAGLVRPDAIAVAGQSDGGEAALAVAYDRAYRDPRVRAAVLLSGARIPGRGFRAATASPPLLATQGTADAVDPPRFTRAFFRIAQAPKYLLTLIGASHLGPYTNAQPQERIVERVSVAFLDGYLEGVSGTPQRIVALGDVRGRATVTAVP